MCTATAGFATAFDYLMPDETALRELSEQVIEKLKLLTDAEFAELEFSPD